MHDERERPRLTRTPWNGQNTPSATQRSSNASRPSSGRRWTLVSYSTGSMALSIAVTSTFFRRW
jgi:hypothetical protein